MAGLYIHIPFCHSKCAYCDFYSTPAAAAFGRAEEMVEVLIGEFNRRRIDIGEPIRTVYVGGGTPSSLPLYLLERLLKVLAMPGVEEFTIEVNPEDVDGRLVELLRRSGVNRVSMGVQSAIDSELAAIGRRHNWQQSAEAVKRLKDGGVANLSLDLMFGLPGQSLDSWTRSLEQVLKLEPQHLSAYSLMLEQGTRLWAMVQAGKLKEAPQELSEAMYDRLCVAASQAGMEHYEISNFALPGRRSRHNSAYWNLVPYLGLGPGAHSYLGGIRSSNRGSLKEYLSSGGKCSESEELTPSERIDEYLLIRLRTAEGISPTDYEALFGPKELQRLLAAAAGPTARGLLVASPDGHLAIPEQHWLIADSIIVDLMP